MAGLIAGADIMFGGRTPHPYHTRPGMVSRSNDGDPHGKAPSGVPGNDPKRPGRTVSSAGTPLVRIGRGEYVLASATVPGGDSTGPGLLLPVPAAGRGRAASLSEDEVKQGAKEYLEAAGFLSRSPGAGSTGSTSGQCPARRSCCWKRRAAP